MKKNLHATLSKRFRGKQVLVLGLGSYPQGSGAAAVRFFSRLGAKVTVTDKKTAKELEAALRRLRGVRATFVLGRHRAEDIDRADLIVRNPAVPWYSPYLARARKRGIPITNDAVFFLEHSPARVIGVTGTRGKSTTSALIAEMYSEEIRNPKSEIRNKSKNQKSKIKNSPRVWLGGNMKVSPLTFLERVQPEDVVVLELSSWMTEQFPAAGVSPAIGVFTNLLRDHLNSYSSMEDYFRAKAAMFSAQGHGDVAILSYDTPRLRRFGKEVPGRRVWTSCDPLPEENAVFIRGGKIVAREAGKEFSVIEVRSLGLSGEHNAMNALAAIAAARAGGVSWAAIRSALRAFRGLPDRQEEVRNLNGVTFVNDTTATTPDATIAALRRYAGRDVVLIAGGTDKNLVFGELASEIVRSARALVFLPGTATAKMERLLGRNKRVPFEKAESMAEAVRLARAKARRGSVVLLSPGAASFGLFRNEFDRGVQFLRAVRRLRTRL